MENKIEMIMNLRSIFLWCLSTNFRFLRRLSYLISHFVFTSIVISVIRMRWLLFMFWANTWKTVFISLFIPSFHFLVAAAALVLLSPCSIWTAQEKKNNNFLILLFPHFRSSLICCKHRQRILNILHSN